MTSGGPEANELGKVYLTTEFCSNCIVGVPDMLPISTVTVPPTAIEEEVG
jgi:hypothetical protein